MKTLLALLLLIPSLSWANKELYKPIQDNLPPLDTEFTVYMGDRMLEQRTGMYAECITPLFNVSKDKFGGWTSVIIANEPLCKNNPSDDGYYPTYINSINNNPGYEDESTILKVVLSGNTDGKYKLCLKVMGMNNHCVKKLSSNDFKYENVFISQENSMQRVIEYAGKKGTIIKFIYSEFKDNMIRDAFTREFEVDLNDGMTIAYKGTVFEVLKVDNASITYKVIRHFQD